MLLQGRELRDPPRPRDYRTRCNISARDRARSGSGRSPRAARRRVSADGALRLGPRERGDAAGARVRSSGRWRSIPIRSKRWRRIANIASVYEWDLAGAARCPSAHWPGPVACARPCGTGHLDRGHSDSRRPECGSVSRADSRVHARSIRSTPGSMAIEAHAWSFTGHPESRSNCAQCGDRIGPEQLHRPLGADVHARRSAGVIDGGAGRRAAGAGDVGPAPHASWSSCRNPCGAWKHRRGGQPFMPSSGARQGQLHRLRGAGGGGGRGWT